MLRQTVQPQLEWVLKQQINQSAVYKINFDFTQVFDKVDESIICHSLRSFCISGELEVLLYDFLNGRN